VNIWTPEYDLNWDCELKVDGTKRGINRFSHLLPVSLDERVVSDEGCTPLVKMDGFYLKDESENPTGSFKDRGIAALVSEAKRHGVKRIAIPSTGNAAISLGYYGGRAAIETFVFVPVDTSTEKLNQIKENSEIITDKDLIESYEHFFRFCRKDTSIHNGFPANNVAYLQGLKTIAYELFMQLGGSIPDHVLVPVGSGGNIVGLYYGFQDLIRMGVSERMPYLVSVQLSGADPITQGIDKGKTTELFVLDSVPESRAEAIASDTCFNYFKIISLIRETRGLSISVSDEEIEAVDSYPDLEYSSRAVFPAFEKLKKRTTELGSVVLIGTGKNR